MDMMLVLVFRSDIVTRCLQQNLVKTLDYLFSPRNNFYRLQPLNTIPDSSSTWQVTTWDWGGVSPQGVLSKEAQRKQVPSKNKLA